AAGIAMKLRSRKFEQQARSLVRAEIRASAAMKKQFRQAPKQRRLQKMTGVMLVAYGMFAVGLGYGNWAARAIGSASLVAVCVSVPMMLLLATFWLAHLERAADPIWRALPLSRPQLLAQRARSFGKPLLFCCGFIAFAAIALQVRGEI